MAFCSACTSADSHSVEMPATVFFLRLDLGLSPLPLPACAMCVTFCHAAVPG
jgi:hypothetical protein